MGEEEKIGMDSIEPGKNSGNAANADSPKKVGVFICHCGGNISDVVNIEELTKYAAELEDVIVYDYRFVCSQEGQNLIRSKIKEDSLGGIVVASCTPKMYEEMWRDVAGEAGINPYLVEVANIREQVSYPHWFEPEKATEKAKSIIKSQIEKVKLLEPLEVKTAKIAPGVAVVGAGIAGMQASLQLADLGHKVHLIEKSPTIGGYMARLVKTFPTDDCAMCTLSPKMNEVFNHPNIELYTYSEVEEIERSPGKLTLKITKKPRYVDEEKCTGCGRCEEKCPVKVLSEWNSGISERKAIRLEFSQALPRVWTIDTENCFYFKKGKCRLCQNSCPAKAVDFEQKPEEVVVDAGALILATGLKEYDPTVLKHFGYGKNKDVLTQMQIARMLDSLSPTKGHILRPSDGKEAKDIVMIQCVGSRGDRDDPLVHPYCSRICCMVAIKHASLIKKVNPDARIYICYNDIRAYGKGYEEYYSDATSKGVKFVKGLPGDVKKEGDKLVVQVHDILTNEHLALKADVVVLSNAIEPSNIENIVEQLHIDRSPDGFIKEFHPKIRPTDTSVKNVFVAGVAQGPKDITDSIAQAGSAAMSAAVFLGKGEMTLNPMIATVVDELCRACGRCEDCCEFRAIKVNPDTLLAEVDATLCEGCGKCAVVCPTGAVKINSYKLKQLKASLEALS
jgi:heterodisulfide reductase subunit A